MSVITAVPRNTSIIVRESDNSPSFMVGEIVFPNGSVTITGQTAIISTQVVGGSINLVWDETPNGLINGSNATFTTLGEFIPGKINVFCNGIKLKSPDDYVTVGTQTINLTFSPSTGEKITVNYQQ